MSGSKPNLSHKPVELLSHVHNGGDLYDWLVSHYQKIDNLEAFLIAFINEVPIRQLIAMNIEEVITRVQLGFGPTGVSLLQGSIRVFNERRDLLLKS